MQRPTPEEQEKAATELRRLQRVDGLLSLLALGFLLGAGGFLAWDLWHWLVTGEWDWHTLGSYVGPLATQQTGFIGLDRLIGWFFALVMGSPLFLYLLALTWLTLASCSDYKLRSRLKLKAEGPYYSYSDR